MNITVYLGASEIEDPRINQSAIDLGKWIGDNGHTLIYGGSRMGLMGKLAISALENGADVIGVEPEMFMEAEFQLDILKNLIVTKTMAERKLKMIEFGDAFIAFPGGTGTLEEISEVMSQTSLDQLDAPCIFFNLDHYYDHIKDHLDNMIEKGLSTKERLSRVYFADSIEEIAKILNK